MPTKMKKLGTMGCKKCATNWKAHMVKKKKSCRVIKTKDGYSVWCNK